MAKVSGSVNNWGILLVLITAGIIIGSFVGAFLGHYYPWMKLGANIGLSPHTWDLSVVKLTFGLTVNVNLFSILGIALGIYIYRKM